MIPRAPRLFGRDRDLAIVRDAIDLGSTAIVGAPGVGKTELALHLAATSERQVVWVDLSSAWDGDEARAAIARELGIPLRTRDPAEGRAAIARSASARGDLLFVLDGAETCLEEVRALSQLVRALSVSRAPVEGAHAVEPLASPAALELFLDRASLDPSRDERALAQRVVGLLGGYPAAIELAAPCSLRRLADTLDLDLDPGDPAVVQATIAWAIERLSPEACAALSRAAVFERPFSFDAFERISPGTPFDVLTLLADAGLVRVSGRRASMERMVRARALRGLDDAEFRHVLGLHASLMGDHALAGLRAFEGEAPPRLPDTADLQSAHATALVDRDFPGEKACALALALVLPDPSRASIFDLDRLDSTIGIAGATPFGGRVRSARAALARSLGRPTEAGQGFAALRELARTAGDRLLEARALLGLGDLALDAGAIDEALRHDEEALARGALEAPHLLAHVLPSLARGRRARGDFEDAVMLLERAIVAESHGGAPRARALLHVELARVRLDQGKRDEACAILERTLPRLEGDVRAVARGLSLLGRARDDRTLLERGLRAARAAAAPRSEAEASLGIAAHDLVHGDLGSARNYALSAIDLSASDGDMVGAARATGFLGVVLASLDAREDAAAAFVTAGACGDRLVSAAAFVHRGHLELAHARLARIRGDAKAASALTIAAASRVATSHPGHEARAASRILERALAGQGAISIELEPSRLRLIDGSTATLERRPTLRRLFDALVRRRIELPGTPLAFDDLLTAGWPGERFPKKVGKDRLHTSLATLRDLGLRSALLSDDSGWRLSPEIPLDLR